MFDPATNLTTPPAWRVPPLGHGIATTRPSQLARDDSQTANRAARRRLRLLVVHNYYRLRGGEDAVFENEVELLRSAGHEVTTLTADNDDLQDSDRVGNGVRSIWNGRLATTVRELVRTRGIEVAHFHNTMPQISPTALRAARAGGAAVLLTLHNYRLLCPAGTMFRNGSTCESCVGLAFPWPGVARGCYRNSRMATATIGAATLAHRALGTWSRTVDRFVVLSDFARRKFEQAGLPANKIAIKPNFVVNPSDLQGPRSLAGYVLFVGRLAPEKGILTLLEGARLRPDIPIRIAGDGPLADQVRRAAATLPNVHWLGQCRRERIVNELADALCLAFPSTWYEGMPMTVLEAFAAGIPVVASDRGAIPELVSHGENGLLVAPGSAPALMHGIGRLSGCAALRQRLSHGALASYCSRFTPAENLAALEQIYVDAIRSRRSSLEVT